MALARASACLLVSLARAMRLSAGGRPVQLDHRRGGQAGELAVESGDLGPVAWLVDVQGRDRGLDHVGPAAVEGERPVEDRAANGDLLLIPQGAILVGEQYEL